MIWSKGYTSAYYATIVDAKTWRDTKRLELTAGKISRSTDELMESADIDITENIGEQWIRIWLEAEQGGIETVPLFTGLISTPKRNIDGFRESYNADCYSVLKPIDDILTERGFYIPAEVPAPSAAARLLRKGIAPVEVADATLPTLTEAIIAEDGETCLTIARRVLDAIKWRIRIDGRGVIRIEPDTDNVALIIGSNNDDIMELSITDEQDWFSCPNVLRAISGDLTAIARDDDPKSKLSTVSRGREIWAEEGSVTLSDTESLADYANRRLREMQSPARKITYTRRFYPDVNVGSILHINYPEINIDGDFCVASQSIELTYGCATNEEAVEV